MSHNQGAGGVQPHCDVTSALVPLIKFFFIFTTKNIVWVVQFRWTRRLVVESKRCIDLHLPQYLGYLRLIASNYKTEVKMRRHGLLYSLAFSYRRKKGQIERHISYGYCIAHQFVSLGLQKGFREGRKVDLIEVVSLVNLMSDVR